MYELTYIFNNLSSNGNINNKSFVFDELLSAVRLHTDQTIFMSLLWATHQNGLQNVKFAQSIGCKDYM